MLISRNLHMKRSEVSIKTRLTPASLSFKGQATKHTTVKWSISPCQLCSERRSIWKAYYNKRDPLKILKCCLPELVLFFKRDLNDHSTFCFAAQTKLSLNIMAEYHTLDSCNKRNKSLSSILNLSDLSVIE